MPPPVGKKLVALGPLAIAVALATAGAAAAAYGGFQPQHAHSPNVHHTNVAYWVVFGFTAAIFILVETALVFCIVRYRARGRSRAAEGMQVHGNTRLEVIWTILPVAVIAAIGTVIFIELPKITPPARAASNVEITVKAHQFYWEFKYPNGATTINDLWVPVGQNVRLTVVSADVDHSFWVPQLQGKIQALPGRVNHTGFRADRAGTYYGYCALICGPYHAKMRTRVIAVAPDEYSAAIKQHTSAAELGRTEFQGVCATCHGLHGQGGYGPGLAANSILTQRSALASIVRNGRGQMPPVGDTWTDEQIDALVAYTKSHVYQQGAATSGG
jgi:cytochrome c oxidase subunit 2